MHGRETGFGAVADHDENKGGLGNERIKTDHADKRLPAHDPEMVG